MSPQSQSILSQLITLSTTRAYSRSQGQTWQQNLLINQAKVEWWCQQSINTAARTRKAAVLAHYSTGWIHRQLKRCSNEWIIEFNTWSVQILLKEEWIITLLLAPLKVKTPMVDHLSSTDLKQLQQIQGKLMSTTVASRLKHWEEWERP